MKRAAAFIPRQGRIGQDRNRRISREYPYGSYVRINPVKRHATLIRSITHLAGCMHTNRSLPIVKQSSRISSVQISASKSLHGIEIPFQQREFPSAPDGRKYESDCYWRIPVPSSLSLRPSIRPRFAFVLRAPHSPPIPLFLSCPSISPFTFLPRSPVPISPSSSSYRFCSYQPSPFIPLSLSSSLLPSLSCLCSQFNGIDGSVTVPLEGLSVHQTIRSSPELNVSMTVDELLEWESEPLLSEFPREFRLTTVEGAISRYFDECDDHGDFIIQVFRP